MSAVDSNSRMGRKSSYVRQKLVICCFAIRCVRSPCSNAKIVVLEWKIFSGRTTLTPLEEVYCNDGARSHRRFQGSNTTTCRCTTISIGAKQAMQKVLKAFLHVWPSMPKSFPEDVGHSSDKELKKIGVLRSPTNQTVCGTRSLSRRNDDDICRKRASCIQRNECFIQRTSEKQRWWTNIDTLQRAADCRASTTHQCFRQSAQCPQSRGGLVPRSCSASRSSLST